MSTKASDVKSGAKASAAPAAAEAPATASAAPNGGVSFVGKISSKTVWGKVEKPSTAHALFTVLGVAHGIKTGTTDKGEFTAFLGSFEATNSKTGERFAAGKCFLPGIVTEMLVSALAQTQAVDAGNSLRFALEIGVKPEEKNAYGYVYTVKPLVKLAANDALADLRAEIAGALTHGG